MIKEVEYKKDLDKLKNIVSESKSLAQVLRQYDMCPNGANPKRLRDFLIEQQIDFSHFNNPKDCLKSFKTKYSLKQILSNEVPYEDTRSLKKRLIKEGLKENRCEKCGITEWLGEPISVQLHHVDGNHKNNNLSNLQMLCPNCHSQTHNFCGKNVKPTPKTKTITAKRKAVRPETYEQFIQEMDALNWNYCAMGRKYGVSDNAIRKWEKAYKKLE